MNVVVIYCECSNKCKFGWFVYRDVDISWGMLLSFNNIILGMDIYIRLVMLVLRFNFNFMIMIMKCIYVCDK